MGCSNCLFSECDSESGGGVVFGYAAQPDPHPLRFVFFNLNTGSNGKDVCVFYDALANSGLLFRCFSTTQGKKVGFWTSNWNWNSNMNGENWLPHECDWIHFLSRPDFIDDTFNYLTCLSLYIVLNLIISPIAAC